MPDANDTADLQEQLAAHRATLAVLLRQRASLGADYAPPGVHNGIAESRREIAQLKAALRAASVEVENQVGDLASPGEGSASACATSGIPACPAPNAAQLFGRDTMITILAGLLIAGQGTVAISAVRGLPGVGKTDLLRATGRDARITAHFAGGVLYAELGPTPSPSSILRRWIAELGHKAPQSDAPETLAAVVRAALRDRRALLILDDVWESSLGAARVLRECASPDCRALTSSRSAQVAREAALGTEPLTLDVLTPTAALDLLRGHASAAVARDETGAAELAQALGYLPLALKLAGHLLANDRRNPQPIPALLKTWRARLNELRGHESRPSPPRLPQRERGLGGEGQLSLDAIIGLSYDALPDDATRAAAAALAAFGAMPLDWDWDAMAAVWETDEEATTALEQALVGCGLIEWDEQTRRYSLHATVHAFLERRAEPAVCQRHAMYYAKLMRQHGEQTLTLLKGDIDTALATLDREIWQMERAQRRATLAEPTSFWDARLIDYAFACASYFSLRGRYEELIIWSETGRQAAQRQKRGRDAATLLNNIAIVYERTGRYEEAIAAYQEAIIVYRASNLEADLAMGLGNLGSVYYHQGRYNETIDHYQQSLAISRRIGDTTGIALTLGNLGLGYYSQGLYEEAIDHYQQSLEIKRRIGDIAEIALTLGNLGIIYKNQERYDEALDHYQQSLEISHRIGDVATTARQLWNLGLLYEKQGDPAQALPLIEEAAQIAERIGMPHAAELRAKAERLQADHGRPTTDHRRLTTDD